jgi:hypothetical protein
MRDNNMNPLRYKGYEGTCELDEDGTYYGKITNIKGLVTYEADSEQQLAKEFELAVDDYLKTLDSLIDNMNDPFYTSKQDKLILSIKFNCERLRVWLYGRYMQAFKVKVTSRTVDSIDMHPCEIEYKDKNGKLVGYWAYGSFDPNFPYQGQY